MNPPVYIEDEQQLRAALETAARSDIVTIDTEFMREKTYFARLCLVQLATDDICLLIDPLRLNDLSTLHAFLAEPARMKVLHAARQDLEVLLQDGGRLPAPLFDTQVAAGLLGMPGQIGYADLVKRRLDVLLPKGHARTDWTARPLSAEQIEYAADDVRYLIPLYRDLSTALENAGRVAWLEEEMQALQNPALYRTEPTLAWQRLRGLDQLAPTARSVAKQLAQWREQEAIDRDRPRAWILADEALRQMAEQLPQTSQQLSNIPALSPTTIGKRGNQIIEAIRIGVARAGEEEPAILAPRADRAQMARISSLMSFVRSEAERLEISPELLATRRDIEHYVFSGELGNPAHGWRRIAIGESLLAQSR
jgi:ribonuclease D